MKVVPFQAEHFWGINPQESQNYVRERVDAREVKLLEQMASFTVLKDDKPMACFGWLEQHKARATLWGYLDKDAGEHMIALTRIGKRMVDGLSYRRIEMEVDCEFEAGHRWAKMLGLKLEVERLKATRTDGGDSAVYAKTRT